VQTRLALSRRSAQTSSDSGTRGEEGHPSLDSPKPKMLAMIFKSTAMSMSVPGLAITLLIIQLAVAGNKNHMRTLLYITV
jgi:hypothetical protein